MKGPRGYHIEGVLGRGGFGKVYLAEFRGSAQFSKRVALKLLLREGMHVDVEKRLRDEGRMLGRLDHPNVVGVSDVVNLDGRWAIVMEFVPGVDLTRLVAALSKEGTAVPAGPALRIVEEVADALDHAHRKLDLLHRDIKPGNIRITPHGRVKVLDFGVARAALETREAHTVAGTLGTLGYLAPERFEMVDCHQGDVYALGVVLFEMLAARRFERTSPVPDKHAAHVAKRLGQLRRSDPPEAVIALLERVLAYAPADRPSAGELEQQCAEIRTRLGGETLQEWVADVSRLVPEEPIVETDELSGSWLAESQAVAVPTPEPSRLGPWVALGVVLFSAAVVVALVSGLTYGWLTQPSGALSVQVPTADQQMARPRVAPVEPVPATAAPEVAVRPTPSRGRVQMTFVEGQRPKRVVMEARGARVTFRSRDIALAPGTWTVLVDWGDGTLRRAVDVAVAAGRLSVVECSFRAERCRLLDGSP